MSVIVFYIYTYIVERARFTVGFGTGDGRDVGRVNDRRVRAPVERIVLRFVVLDALLLLLLLVVERGDRRVAAPRHLGDALEVVHLRPGTVKVVRVIRILHRAAVLLFLLYPVFEKAITFCFFHYNKSNNLVK